APICEKGGKLQGKRKELQWCARSVSQKKLSKVIVPDKWKEGASNTNESGGRKINENKLLSKKRRSSFEFYPFTLWKLRSWSLYFSLLYFGPCILWKLRSGLLMEILSASFASSKCTKTASTVTLVLIPKVYVRCVASKCSTPSFTSRAMYNKEGALAVLQVDTLVAFCH
ncbi:hypothetical protein Gotur_021479, partial [Gossypium turneri]